MSTHEASAIPAASDFRREMELVGIVTRDEIIPDGRLHRFDVEGDKPRRDYDSSPLRTFGPNT